MKKTTLMSNKRNKNLAKMAVLMAASLSVTLWSCKDEQVLPPESGDLQTKVLNDYSQIVCLKTYETLAGKTTQLHLDIQAFVNTPSDNLLNTCRSDWKNAREVWENSEAWLFGPVATNEIDPRIDTWPVDFVRLDSVLNSNSVFSNAYINSLEESLKGFHPIEYLLFGLNSNKKASDFTQREKEYLLALSENLKDLTTELRTAWDPQGGNYIHELLNAGSSTGFPTKKSAYEEMVNAMIGICDEVGNGKIGEVLTNLDSMGEESPFAKNSITDFRNNILGVKYAYLSIIGNSDGKGIEDIVREKNLSLDGKIKQKIDAAIVALNNITDPFGRAIHTQPIQVQNAVDAINVLKNELEDGLLPFIQLNIK